MAPPVEIVVLTPSPDGTVGSLTVIPGGGVFGLGAWTLSSPFETLQLAPGGRVTTGFLTPAEVRFVFGAAIDARPMRPQAFHLFFKVGEADVMTPEAPAVLQQIVSLVALYAVPELVIIGHTDRTGTTADNDVLAVRRAEFVQSALAQRGVRAPMTIIGRGERDATVNEDYNRRVEVILK